MNVYTEYKSIKHININELINLLDKYDMQETMFQVPADIYCHAANTKSISDAIWDLEALNGYWNRQNQNTLFFIWHEERMKVWNGKDYVFKNVVKISAVNDKISEFALSHTMPLD